MQGDEPYVKLGSEDNTLTYNQRRKKGLRPEQTGEVAASGEVAATGEVAARDEVGERRREP